MILLTKNEYIAMAGQPATRIKTLKLGEEVQGWSRDNIVNAISYRRSAAPSIRFNDEITVTRDQLLLLPLGEWISASDIKLGTELAWSPGEGSKGSILIDTIVPIMPNAPTFLELELDGDHSFVCNGFYLHNFGGGEPEETTTISKSEPPAYLAPYLTDIAKKAQTSYGLVPQGGFEGQFIASPQASQLTALGQQQDIAEGLQSTGFGTGTAQVADQFTDKLLSGGYTAPAQSQFAGQNLATQGAVNAYLQPVEERLLEDIIPQLQSEAIQSGAYGGSRMDVTMADRVQDEYIKEAANIASTLGYQEAVRGEEQRFENFALNQALYPELLKTELAAGAMTPELGSAAVNQMLLPSNILSSVGGAEQLFAQDQLDEAYQQFINATQSPFAGLDQYASLIYGQPAGGINTATTPGGGSSSNPVAGALSGGMAGAGIATMLGLSNPVTAPFAIGGALLGGMFG